MGSGSLVLQQLLRWHVCEEHLQNGLSILTVPGVGVPHHAVAQERLCVGSTKLSVWWRKRGKKEKRLYYFITDYRHCFYIAWWSFNSLGWLTLCLGHSLIEKSAECVYLSLKTCFQWSQRPRFHCLHIDKLVYKLVYFIFQLWIFKPFIIFRKCFFFLFLCSIMIKLSDWPVTFLIQSKLQQRLLQQLAATLHLSDRYRQREKITCERRQTVVIAGEKHCISMSCKTVVDTTEPYRHKTKYISAFCLTCLLYDTNADPPAALWMTSPHL